MTRITSGGYDEAVKEEAFAVWLLEADRNCEKTARILAELYPNEPMPSSDSIRNWSRKEDWDAKAQEYLAVRYPNWYHRFHGRQLLQQDRHLEWSDALFHPDSPEFEKWFAGVDPNTVAKLRLSEKVEAAKTLGSGMWGQKDPRYEIPLPHSAGQTDGSPEEVATRFRQRQLKSGDTP